MENISNPFLDLLKPSNISKIRIDEELIPIFKKIIYKLSEFFLKNNLMDVKNWKSFFEKYLLENSSEQYSIYFLDFTNTPYSDLSGRIEYENKRILIDSREKSKKYIYNTFCHEFIHFLSGADLDCLGYSVSYSEAMNEGLTELFSMKVLDYKDTRSYYDEVKLAELYCSLQSDISIPFAGFLHSNFTFSTVPNNNYYETINFIRNCHKMIDMQRYIIDTLLNCDDIDSLEKVLETIKILNKRPINDENDMHNYCERIVNAYLKNNGIENNPHLKKSLKDFCITAYMTELYGSNDNADAYNKPHTIESWSQKYRRQLEYVENLIQDEKEKSYNKEFKLYK